jgi:hypothetical protein
MTDARVTADTTQAALTGAEDNVSLILAPDN